VTGLRRSFNFQSVAWWNRMPFSQIASVYCPPSNPPQAWTWYFVVLHDYIYINNDVILSTVNNTYSPRLHILGCTTLGFPLQTAQTSVIICILIRYQYRWLSDWLPSLSSLLMYLQAFTYQRGFVWKGGIPQPTGWSDSSLRLTILRVCPIFRHTHINLSWISPVYSH
jgi:hypothetical protein